ncbi:unnamed protein product [Prunus brigantina]
MNYKDYYLRRSSCNFFLLSLFHIITTPSKSLLLSSFDSKCCNWYTQCPSTLLLFHIWFHFTSVTDFVYLFLGKYFEHATGRFGGMNLDHRTGLEGESQQDESQHVSGVLLGRPEEDDVKSLFLHGKMKYIVVDSTGQFEELYLDHRTGLAPEEEDNVKSLFLHGKMHATGQFGGLYLDHGTGLAPEEEDNVKSLFLHGKMIRKMSTFILQKEMKLYFEPATGQFVGLYLDHRTGLEGESEQDESTDVSGVPEDMDLSDSGDGGEDNTVDEGGDDTEDEGSGGDEFGFNGGGDGGDSSSDGGPIVHALEMRVKKGVLRRELNRDNYRISYFTHGPTDDGIEVDISGMTWGEVMESELQGAFAHDDLDPGHDDAGASCSRPKRKRQEPTYLKDYYTY